MGTYATEMCPPQQSYNIEQCPLPGSGSTPPPPAFNVWLANGSIEANGLHTAGSGV